MPFAGTTHVKPEKSEQVELSADAVDHR